MVSDLLEKKWINYAMKALVCVFAAGSFVSALNYKIDTFIEVAKSNRTKLELHIKDDDARNKQQEIDLMAIKKDIEYMQREHSLENVREQ